MRRLLIMAFVLLGGGAAMALNAERLLVFFFDPGRVAPEAAGEARLREVLWPMGEQSELVLWVARPAPGRASVLYFHGNAGNLADRVARFS